MGRIARLPVDLANQIAAGEVVERPASVIKELVENAIDAGAHRLAIHIELGGKKQVRVEDDGEGMDAEDARLSVERHATSKIKRADDLAAITTLGFRGEALPSIASVSHFVLRSRGRGLQSGTEIRVNGGAVASVTEVGAPEGTLVQVDDLFYNLPARRKFLKSDGAESAQVSRVVTQLSLAHPDVGFTLTSGGRTVLQWSPASSLADRSYQIYGERTDLIQVKKEVGGVRVSGYVAALADRGPTRGPQNIFVNKRIVKDRTIAHAIIDAYSVASIKERSPEVHLFIEMPPHAVDVNVHPTKAEVRFREQSLIHELVRRALGDALGSSGVPELHLQAGSQDRAAIDLSIPGILSGGIYPNRWLPGGATGTPGPPRWAPRAEWETTAPAAGLEVSAAALPQRIDTLAAGMRPMIPLGQFRDTFIIAVDDDGLAIIDQHVAHERVLFERVMQRLTDGPLESQRLLLPMVIDLSPSARQALLSRGAGTPASWLRNRGLRRRFAQGVECPRAAWNRGRCRGPHGAGRGSRGPGQGGARAGGAQAHGRVHRVPCRGQGQLSARCTKR